MTTRLRLLLALMLTLLMVFTARLMYLQFAMAEEFRAMSTENFLEQRRVSPLRGRILARDGTVLADNRIAVDLMYWGGDVDNWERIAHTLGIPLELEPPDPSDWRERQQGRVVAWNIPDTHWLGVEELVAGQPNLYLRERVERTYPTNLAAQVVGYTTEADPQRFPGYALGELVGQMGVEASFQDVLFGSPGLQFAEVNSRRTTLSTREVLPARPGQDIVLTIDPTLQRLAEDVLQGSLEYVNSERQRLRLPLETTARGAIIAIDLANGEILAMASAPSFDQNVFTRRPSSPDLVTELLTDARNFPMANRAVEAYEPASTFKLVTSSVLLEGGFIQPGTRYACSARYNFLGITFRNWSTGDRGNYDVRQAIADSCNTFYWRAAANTPNATRGWGPFAEALVNRAREFGYGQPLGIGLQEEKAGRIPDNVWARQVYEYGWLPGYTLNMSIGQGDVLATPLQVAQLISTLALNGRHQKPVLVRQAGSVITPPDVRQLGGRYWNVLKEGMRMMVTDFPSPRKYLGGLPVRVAGKTGTAQNPRGDGYFHSWFMGYGPHENPELAVVVFIEHGGSSSAVALPVARDFMAAYWSDER